MDVFDLVAKIRLDSSEYEQGLGKAKGTMSTLASGLKTGLTTVAKVGAAAVTAGVAGVTALTKMGIEGYAQYEQLIGGVETLYGSAISSAEEYAKKHKMAAGLGAEAWEQYQNRQQTVMNNAANAYKTAGMSANDYMNTVNGFAASLTSSLGEYEWQAANYADMIVTDMSDNANKMGTSMEMIQNAYSGFSKQNYTMLDNLKLGYGGTQEEMKRLLRDAEEIAGYAKGSLDISSFADVAEAIHIIQENLGISGTTAREAAMTIEGSISMMKAAWQNLVVGMADENANMEVLINNFVESTATAAKNLLPRIEQTLKGIGQLITALAPVIADALPKLVENVLPALLTAGVSLVTALVQGVVSALPALYTALLDAVQIILVEVFGVSEEKAGEFADSVNSFFVKIKDGFVALVESAKTEGTWLNSVWTGLKATGKAFGDFLVALWDVLSAAFAWCVKQINKEGTYLNTIWKNIQTYISAAVDVIQNVIKLFTAILQGDWSGAWEACQNIAKTVWTAICTIVSDRIEFAKSAISKGLTAAKSVVSSILSAISGFFTEKWNAAKSAVTTAISTVQSSISSGMNSAKTAVSSVLDGIKSKFTTIWDNCTAIVKNAVTALKNALNFSWSLPKLKLPHISVTGGVAPYGIGGKGSLPKFDIEWYRKAYDNAMILSNPTIFGYSGGKFLGGGDGNGNEIVAGESYLMKLIGSVVAERNGEIVELLSALLEATVDGNGEMVRALKAGQVITLNERELGRAVRGLA